MSVKLKTINASHESSDFYYFSTLTLCHRKTNINQHKSTNIVTKKNHQCMYNVWLSQ